MCVDPITATLIGTTVAGTAMSAVGAAQQGQAQAAAAKANAAQARAQSDALLTKTTGDIDQANRRFEINQGKVRNIVGSSGIAPSSFQAVIDDDTREAAIEKATIRFNAGAQQSQLQFAARSEDAKAANAETAGNIGVVSALIGGGKSLAQLSNPSRTPYDNWQTSVTDEYGGVSFIS